MRRGRLPLTALRSFESAGRLLSFTQAAEELFVTQAAISRQIRELERSLGLPLFERHHRSVSLTESGASLLARLTQSFDEIDDALRKMIPGSAPTSLVVSAEPGFAACWLVPRLDRFRAIWPEIDVEILSDSRVIEFRASRAELAIRHSASATSWPRVEAQRLARTVVTPVLSPTLLAHGPPLLHPEDLAGHTLLHEDGRRYWAVWMEQAGISSPRPARGPLFNDGALVIPAALRGHGVALGDLVLVKDDIEAGRLVAPFDLTVSLGSYWLVAPHFDTLSPAARIFAGWLHVSIS